MPVVFQRGAVYANDHLVIHAYVDPIGSAAAQRAQAAQR